MNVPGIIPARGEPVAFVAELSNNANGKIDNAFHLLDAAQEAGATAAKLQCYSVEELIALRGDGPAPSPWDAMTMRDLYTRAMTPRAWFAPLYRYAETIGLPLFSSVFGAESLALLESLGNPVYKLARLDNKHGDLIASAVATGKPVLVSAAPADGLLVGARPNNLRWLYCPSGYPVAVDDVHLPSFDQFGYFGLSSHCLDARLPVAAVARGARLLEYHFMLDDEPSALEADISLTASDFRMMIEDVRATEALLA